MNRLENTATVNGLRMHYLRAGEGPPLFLLHGWPQTSHCWHEVLAPLAETHTVIAPDLRGYGRTDKPKTGFDKRTMAADVAALADHLGFGRVAVAGHDRGGRVAHRWALDRPDQVDRLAVLDIVPTRAMWQRLDTIAKTSWHWLFHLQPDLPELLAGQNVAGYLGYFFERWTYQRRRLDADAVTQPLLALWGANGLLAALPALEIWQEYANDVTGEALAECGHFLPEEQPDEVVSHLRKFLNP
jgi:haloacetate dehalogenase